MISHIIHQQKVTLNVSQSQDSFAMQDRLGALLRNEMPGKIEALLNELTPPNEILRIGSLQIDLGVLPAENFEERFKDRLLEKLKLAITGMKAVAKSKSTLLPEEPGQSSVEIQEKTVAKRESENVKGEATILDTVQSLGEALIYFLEHGNLPWYKVQTDSTTWEAEMIEQFSATDWQHIRQWLLRKIEAGTPIRQRLISQFSNIFLQHLTAVVPTIFSLSEWNEVYTVLLQTGSRIASFSNTRHQLWVAALMLPQKEETKATAIRHIMQAMAAGLQVSLREMIDATADQPVQSPVVQEAYAGLLKETSPKPLEAALLTNNNTLSQFTHNVPQSPEKNNLLPNAANNLLLQPTASETAPQQTSRQPEAVQYVINCGIILLHPFLEMYFTELELVQQKVFVDEAFRQRAVLLLHYLTTGETEAAEFNLILQKLLCGLSSEETLPAQIELTKKEAQESEQLLQSVISYWPPLKNTSTEGLRHTFLQRQGRLEAKENGWLLAVEQKTVDILLSQLPWGFSTIRLPWMNGILNVEWV